MNNSTFKNINYALLTCFFLTFLASCAANKKALQVEKSEDSTYSFAQVEPNIYVNRQNPKQIVAGTVLNDYYTSKNGGKNWKSAIIKSPYGVNGDPVLMADDKGRFYYFHLSNPSEDEKMDRIVCQATDDINLPLKTVGHTPVNGKIHDKQWVAYDENTQTIHMAWTQFDGYKSTDPLDSSIIVYSQSMDQGETWSELTRVSKLAGNCLDDSETIEGVSLAVGAIGEVYITYCLNQKIYFNKSTNNGVTWLEHDVLVAEQPGGWSFDIPGIYRMNGFPSIAVNKNNGKIFISWSDQRNGKNNTDVWIASSSDYGKSWSLPKKVNNDEGENQQFMSAMRIDSATGFLAVLFYDRRAHNDWHTDVYLAVSKDGGENFINTKVSDDAFLPSPSVFFGDYLGLDFFKGNAYCMWSEMHNKKITLKFKKVKVKKLK